MAREGGGIPYTPNLVPQTALDLGAGPQAELTAQIVQDQLRDLERFLEDELGRIQTAMVTSVVQAAYGAMTVDPGPAADQPLDATPQGLTGFNNFTPQVPNRVTADIIAVAGDSLVPEEGGIYQLTAVIAATVDSGSFYQLTAAINGTLSGIFTSIDASQQTTAVTFVFHGLIALNAGDLVTLVGVAQAQGSPHTFIMESAIFSLIRVSERNDEPGQF